MIKFQQLKNFVNSCRSLSLFLSVKVYSRNISYQIKNLVARQECVHKRFYYHKYINKYSVKTDLLDVEYLNGQIKMFKFFRKDNSFYDENII